MSDLFPPPLFRCVKHQYKVSPVLSFLLCRTVAFYYPECGCLGKTRPGAL